MTIVKVIAAQIKVTESVQENLASILSAITEAGKEKTDFICFPEACLVSDETFIPQLKGETKAIRKAAAQANVNVLFGTYVKEKGITRNQIWVINRKGELVYRYNKKHLYATEIEHVKAGKTNKMLTLDGIKFAVINCWDYAFPEYLRKLAQQGADIIFCPSYLLSFPFTKEVLRKIPQVRAFDCMAYFVMVDACAEDSFKHSKICSPLQELAGIEGKPGLLKAELDLSLLQELRARFKNLPEPHKRNP
jgi:predicted amidohydrolase